MGRRGAGRRLNDQERMEILDLMAKEPKTKNVDLAKRYGVSEGAIRKLKQIKDTIRDRYILGNEHNRDKRKRGGFRRNAQFEQELYEWICRMRETQAYQLIPLTQTAVRQQAIILAKNYETMATFKASPGWFARFCSRHRLDPPMAPMRDLDSIAAEAEAAASASENLLASSVVMGDASKLPPSHDASASVDAPMAIAFPQASVHAMQPLEVNVDESVSAAAAAAVSTIAAAAAPAAAVASAAPSTLMTVPAAVAVPAVPAVVSEPTGKPSASMAVDLNCPEAIVEGHTTTLKMAPLSTSEAPHEIVAPAPTAPVTTPAEVPASPKPKVEPSVVAAVVETRVPAAKSVVAEDEIFSLGL